MFSAFDVSTSGLVAQRIRLNAISSNMANMSTTRNEKGELKPYTPRYAVFQTDQDITTPGGGMGVKVSELKYSTQEPIKKQMPNHPDADEDGNVLYPNVNMTTEFVDALEATRAYQANLGVIEITKDLGRQSLRILA